MNRIDHRGKVALITGASRGIGACIAERLATEQLHLALLGRDERALAGVVAQCVSLFPKGKIIGLTCDVTDQQALTATVQKAVAELGSVDVLINNAGMAASAPIAKMTDSLWEQMFSVNVTSGFWLTRLLVPGMVERGWGRVINIASNAGLTGYAYTSAYCAAKHAMVGFTRALAVELARTGVTVNAVCPGFVDTDMAHRAVDNISKKTGKSSEDARATLEALSPQKRLMTPEEIAHTVVSLIPHEARGIHGQSIVIDGGQLLV